MNRPVLVIGGGIGGITAALELAEAGREVILVEKEPYLGGNVSGFHNYFPKLCPPSCGLEINYRRIRSNPRISWFTSTSVINVEGAHGDLEVSLRSEPLMINERCTACGKCAEVCPEHRDPVLAGAPGERAAYMRQGIPFPMRYTIDAEACKKEECGQCADVCAYDAIRLGAEPVLFTKRVHAVIVATGWRLYDVGRIGDYRYRQEPDVITNLEFEKLLSSALKGDRELSRPSDGMVPERIAFIQCAGSRDQRHLPYCSAVCCSATIKHALTMAGSFPGIGTEVFYIDLRLSGRNEKLLRKAEECDSITLTRGKVGRIGKGEDGRALVLEVEDVMKGTRRTASFDLVVLAAGLVPNRPLPEWPEGYGGFLTAGAIPGVYPAGTCKRPMDVASTVRDATGAALKSLQP